MKILTLIPLVLAISACTTRDNHKFCETPVRDLTEDWHSRTYWCLPKGYVPLIEPQTTLKSPAPSAVSSRVPFDTSLMSSTTLKSELKSELRALFTERESLQHKVRVASQESIANHQIPQAEPVLTSKQKEKGIELVESIQKGSNLSNAEQDAILKDTFVTGRKKVEPAIGTEPLSQKAPLPVKVIEPTNEVVKSSSDITSFDVSFTRHNLDTNFSKSDLSKIVGTVSKTDVIKLQGCRQESEIESLVLGRALAVRQALIREGVDNKIVILSNQNCTTDKKVKVNV